MADLPPLGLTVPERRDPLCEMDHERTAMPPGLLQVGSTPAADPQFRGSPAEGRLGYPPLAGSGVNRRPSDQWAQSERPRAVPREAISNVLS